MHRETYLLRYGHRGPGENELSEPRPYEDPNWIDKQLAKAEQSPVDVISLLQKRDAEFGGKRQAMVDRVPTRRAEEFAARIEAIVATNHTREATRSELTRVVGVTRALFLRAGELIGVGEGVFFLTIDEIIGVLQGGPRAEGSAVGQIPDRRDVHQRYAALPPLPAWIRGRFDPFKWASDPNRRSDVFAPGAALPPETAETGAMVRGHPGSAGQVEGLVRRIDGLEEGDQLLTGEILVTSRTNVGWTPLFPRAAAVVTDIGTSLSHAAIVARELGIPAVVGCGDATMRLRTGDRVRVDGGKGLVEILGRDREQE
jgi:pyruvate,water dikinase